MLGWDNSLSSCCVSVAWVILGGQGHSVNVCIERLQGVKYKGESTGRRSMKYIKSFHRTELYFVEDSVGTS